jgi:methylase of polypeptide subunit release factors
MSFVTDVSALKARVPEARERAEGLGLDAASVWNVLVVAHLREVLRSLAQERGLDESLLTGGRLLRTVPGFEPGAGAERRERLLASLPRAAEAPSSARPVEAFGQLYESLLSARPAAVGRDLRKRTGSYYTPESLTRVVVERAFDALGSAAAKPLRILDPAIGGGAFLVQAGREAALRSGLPLAQVVRDQLFGVDISPLALAVAEASLWLLAGDRELTLEAAGKNLREGDALCAPATARALSRAGVDFEALVGAGGSFDLVLGNPPWVAFAGRATQPLTRSLREHYRRHFRAFRGYPTLHALFVEQAARLAPRGVIALLVPSPLADLDGYRPVRRALTETHEPREPLLELGQDAFEGVTQPCFALLATPRLTPSSGADSPFVLTERKRAASAALEVRTPSSLERLASLPRLPPELFGEMGLQTNSAVTRELLYRGTAPPPEYSYSLLEGRNVSEFRVSPPRLFLRPDQGVLGAQRCRLRAAEDYGRVKLVVRQTAAITIAARHEGTPFRNSLLAGFELPELPWALTLGLLNSSLFRALHLASRRDARQGAFPQVKVGHLRALPAPRVWRRKEELVALSLQACERGLDRSLREALDELVFDLFDLAPPERAEIVGFVRELSPRAGLAVPL